MKPDTKPHSAASSLALPAPASPDHTPAWLASAIAWAAGRGATDIHLFPSEREAMFWVRVDGELLEAARYPLACHTRMIARLKVLGRCTDYAGELVQEGRFTLDGSAAGEARLSVIPTLRGEKAVIRLLPGAVKMRSVQELGLGADLISSLRATLDAPQGLLLAVGPSGCGKSTALYALLADLANRAGHPVSIVTIEDPVEQSLPLAAQISADPARGLGFAEGLRAILRQDPEVIMIGEIRDAATATAALQAALTGHRLLSSMHTLTGAEALVRLRQMGAPAYVISSALAGILNLRLVRLLCAECRRPRPLTAEELEQFPEAAAWEAQTLSESPGCPACLGSGHHGRTGLGEWLVPTAETSTALHAAETSAAIARTLEARISARPVALELLRAGRVSPAELRRLTGLATLEEGAHP